ncbi:hypothetical protein NEPAR04_2225 [Nematocida parisii]|nr:hypothetical protein NEPAR04_2225 [Nematocida parisii]KAI5168151.1 hypothetical protein NEIRO02_2429 [Nematocida sp. AWRm79]
MDSVECILCCVKRAVVRSVKKQCAAVGSVLLCEAEQAVLVLILTFTYTGILTHTQIPETCCSWNGKREQAVLVLDGHLHRQTETETETDRQTDAGTCKRDGLILTHGLALTHTRIPETCRGVKRAVVRSVEWALCCVKRAVVRSGTGSAEKPNSEGVGIRRTLTYELALTHARKPETGCAGEWAVYNAHSAV